MENSYLQSRDNRVTKTLKEIVTGCWFYDICQDLCQECSLTAAFIKVSGRSRFKGTINTALENSYFETIRRKTFCLVLIKCQK